MSIYGRDLTGEAVKGDYELTDGLDNLKAAILRRLETPKGALFAHPDYGNPAWDLLSEEMDEDWAVRVVAAIKECLEQEPRVQRVDVSYELFPETRTARFYIYFVPIESQVTENLIWEVTTGAA